MNHEHIKNLKLADTSLEDQKGLNILIGLDYYYQLMLGNIIRGKNNEPVAVESIFGWVLCGSFHKSDLSPSNNLHILVV